MRGFCNRFRFILRFSAIAFSAGLTPGLYAQAQTTNNAPVHTLMRELIIEYGGTTNALPKFSGSEKSVWQVTKDPEGSQVWFNGNQMEPLEAMFKATFGTPVYISTNTAGKTMFQYNIKQTGGVGLSCRLDTVKDKSMYTHVVILGPKGLDALSGKSNESPAPIQKSAE